MRKIIYTDGSHLKHTTGRLGIGGIMVDSSGKVVDKFSEEIDVKWLMNTYGTSDVSNPTCEMLAVLVALRKFKLSPGDEVIMKQDYLGCMNFIEGTWKAKKPYIKAIRDDILKEIESIGLRGRISFEWVKGHQTGPSLSKDAIFNGMVDKLAKGL